ncbi:MAG: hypothetical protein ABL927_14095 [Bdellovibrionales bacterium]
MIISLKKLDWIGDSKERLCEFPEMVMKEIGYALYIYPSQMKS